MREIKLRLRVEKNRIYEDELVVELRKRGFWRVGVLRAWVRLREGDILLVEELVDAWYRRRIAILGPEENEVMIVEDGELVKRRMRDIYLEETVKSMEVVGNVFENPELVKKYQLGEIVEEYFK